MIHHARRFKLLLSLIGLLAVLIPAATLYAQEAPQQVYDALAALNAKLGTQLTLGNMDYWTWEQQIFPDTSMGCPLAGQTYTQTSTSGYIVQLTYKGTTYDYRVSTDRQTLFLCSPGGGASSSPALTPSPTTPPIPPPASGTVVCPGGLPTRLASGMQAVSITSDSINIRTSAGTTSQVAGLLLPGGTANVLSGPQCVSNQTWWKISYLSTVGSTITGWVMEGDPATSEYWLQPVGGVPAVPPAASTATLITASSVSRITLITQATLPETVQQAAFLPSAVPTIITVPSTGQQMKYYSGTPLAQVATLGHMGISVRMASAAASDATTTLLATIEAIPTDPTKVNLWVWQITPGAAVPTMAEKFGAQLPVASVNDLTFSPNGKRLAVSSGSILGDNPTAPNVVWVWDTSTGVQIALSHTSPVISVAFSPDGNTLATTTLDNQVHWWNVTSQTEQAAISCSVAKAGKTLAFMADGTLLAVGGEDGNVTLLDNTTHTLRSTLPLGDNIPVRWVAFNPDGTVLLIAKGLPSGESPLIAWGVNVGSQLVALHGLTGSSPSIALSADGTQVMAVSGNTWLVWGIP